MKKTVFTFVCFVFATVSGFSVRADCVSPPSGLVLWLPFDETTGNRAANLAPGGNIGLLTNNPAHGTGYVAGDLFFDIAYNEYVYVTNYSGINPGTGDFTIDAWIQGSYGGSPTILVDKRNPVTGIGYSLRTHNNKLELELQDASGVTDYTDTVNLIIGAGSWRFVAVTVNRTSTTGGHFFINGAVTSTFNPTARSGSLNNTNFFRVDCYELFWRRKHCRTGVVGFFRG